MRGARRGWSGLAGLQGSGKSTLAAQLCAALTQRGIATLAMSLDDFYFGRGERKRLARDVHPLLATRGVPGTHDLDLLARTVRRSAPRIAAASGAGSALRQGPRHAHDSRALEKSH